MDEANVSIVCTLSPNEMGQRLDEFSELFAEHLVSVTLLEPTRATVVLRAAEGVEAATRDLFAREQECCPFFSFDMHCVGETLVVAASVPVGAELALDGLLSIARRA